MYSPDGVMRAEAAEAVKSALDVAGEGSPRQYRYPVDVHERVRLPVNFHRLKVPRLFRRLYMSYAFLPKHAAIRKVEKGPPTARLRMR